MQMATPCCPGTCKLQEITLVLHACPPVSVSQPSLVVKTQNRLDEHTPEQTPHFTLVTSLETLSPQTLHSEVLGVRVSTYRFEGHTLQPMNVFQKNVLILSKLMNV